MRKGNNPQKEAVSNSNEFTHHVVMPVYIPSLEDYYKESLEILKMSIGSLEKTVHEKTFISIINNGSCAEVAHYLDKLHYSKVIHELVHTTNIGKINAILKGIAGHQMPFVTITDADILFKNDWQEETQKIFNVFPKVGVAGIIPQFKMFSTYSSNLIFDRFFNKTLMFTEVLNPKAMELFYKSIGWDNSYNPDYLKKNLTLRSKKCHAIVGSGHAVATYKKEIFKNLLGTTSKFKLGGDSEIEFLDKTVLKFDGWRLTTAENYAYHMGNKSEKWMNEELNSLKQNRSIPQTSILHSKLNLKPITYLIKVKIFKRLLKTKTIYRLFLRLKGLPIKMINTY